MIKPAIAPSILSANFSALGDDIQAVLQAGADMIHFDVMDNHYVPNLSFGPMVLKSLRKSGMVAPVDVHLMTKPVDGLIEAFIDAGADWITFHPEASEHVDRSLQLIKAGGCKAGLALNPSTPPEILEYVMNRLDMILVMSVNPGFGGQKFLSSAIEKLKKVRKLIDNTKQNIRLQVDGGVTAHNIREIALAGADTFVAGSAIFGQEDYKKAIGEMRSAIEQ